MKLIKMCKDHERQFPEEIRLFRQFYFKKIKNSNQQEKLGD